MSYKKAPHLTGRIDGTAPDMLRWHQVINYIDLAHEKISLQKNERGVVFLDFAVDEGVKRNRGRDGAHEGGAAIAKAFASFPDHFKNTKIFHGGVITCDNCNLEKAQNELAHYVEKILEAGCLPIVLGGGHEVSYGHYQGVKNFTKNHKSGKKIGIINFDAHFDIRPVEENIGATSGTGFWQIAQDTKTNGDAFNYLVLGIQKFSNTKILFKLAEEMDVQYALGDEFNFEGKNALVNKVKNFIDSVDHIYLTICMDVFASCYSPGVSAPSPNGIAPDHVFKACFDEIVKSPKFLAFDFAETNPIFDVDQRSAKLAASLIFRALSN